MKIKKLALLLPVMLLPLSACSSDTSSQSATQSSSPTAQEAEPTENYDNTPINIDTYKAGITRVYEANIKRSPVEDEKGTVKEKYTQCLTDETWEKVSDETKEAYVRATIKKFPETSEKDNQILATALEKCSAILLGDSQQG
ncbi:MAG: hypothetical protein J6M18_01345 [Actinomycetaceae bacterium]|nr:hypothetical protein [Actinomycetaceae bacterium]